MVTRYNMKKALAHYEKIIELRQDQNYLLADDMARLHETELPVKDLYHICCKLQKAAYLSTEPFLHQERVDAVRYLLEYGLGNSRMENRFSYLPKLTREQAKAFLLSAPLTEICTFIDIVASGNRELYSVERGIDVLDTNEGQALLNALTSFADRKQTLDDTVRAARKEHGVSDGTSETKQKPILRGREDADKSPTR